MLARDGVKMGRLRALLLGFAGLAIWIGCFAGGQGRAEAAVPTLLGSFPETATKGAGAGQLSGAFGVATDPTTGHVYVTGNGRISEFDAWGSFVKAFGWDVSPGGVNERQEIRLRATSGQFKLSFGAPSTADLSFDATAQEVEVALDGLATISSGGGGVRVTGGPGGIVGQTPSVYVVTFDRGPLAETDVDQLGVGEGTAPLAGGLPSTLLETRTLANGTAAGAGLEACTPESGCQAGTEGPGAGQVDPRGLAVDSAGDMYVFEQRSFRVQKFSAAGEFLLMFGGGVNKTTGADVCTEADLEAGEACGAGTEGTGGGSFNPPDFFLGSTIAIGSDGTVYVGDQERIQEFEPDGAFKGEITFADLNAEDARFPSPGSVGGLAFDQVTGDLYFAEPGNQFDPVIFRVDAATGTAAGVLDPKIPPDGKVARNGELSALATDAAGHLFAVVDPGTTNSTVVEPRVLEWGRGGEALIDFADEFAAPRASLQASSFVALATNPVGNLYVSEGNSARNTSKISAYGPPPLSYGPPPRNPPAIVDQFAASVGTTSAVLRAKINPRFWDDTRYSVEYGVTGCATINCSSQPPSSGLLLTDQLVNAPLTTEGITLGGLEPGTIYHYRFVAESSGGMSVGLSGKVGEEAEGSFTTATAPVAQPSCPNDSFRPGAGAFLPDCRAYEMVSPVDKNGADISVVLTFPGDKAQIDQVAPSGDALTYSAYRAFGAVESAPYTSQYLASRSATGWSSRGISPPQKGPMLLTPIGLDTLYWGFTADLCKGWLMQPSDIPLAEGWVPGWTNLYRREICAGGYEALAPRKPPTVAEVAEYRPLLEGFSADGTRAFFVSKGKLASNAQAGDAQAYEVREGQSPRLLCILPSGTAFTGECSVGTADSGSFRGTFHQGRGAWLSHAVSDDGTVVYWTAADGGTGAEGDLYVRLDGRRTVPVSAGASPARFWWAARDGSRALYSEGGVLREFDLAEEASRDVAGGFLGLMGASDDASHAYFVSTEALAAGASAGEFNLYLYEVGAPGSFTFIAALSDRDVTGVASPISSVPVQHRSQVAPDGGVLAFMSSANLTGADNFDLESGEPDAQVYVYRAADDQLICASCNITNARPSGRSISDVGSVWAAGQIPGAETQLQFPQVLSDDGTQLFFESFDALSPRDVNGKKDVYEWEAAGSGTCGTSSPGYDRSYAGCVDLISSGQSSTDSEIVDSGADGRDVFFTTESSLRPEDPGQVDIYDARARGGFPFQPSPPIPCQGEDCQAKSVAPASPTPATGHPRPPGNLKPKGCRRETHHSHKQKRARKHGKPQCVKNRKHRKRRHKHHHHAGAKRSHETGRAGR
jgi:hypothetical protein